MKVLLDMNLSPEWCEVLAAGGFDAIHWSAVGDPRAVDRAIMDWARAGGHVVLTHDLDFGAILAASRAERPSVVLVRSQNLAPAHLGNRVVEALRSLEAILERGAIVSLDERGTRARVLPLRD